jgi:branched-chain amino acid transport system substrate-binding protein
MHTSARRTVRAYYDPRRPTTAQTEQTVVLGATLPLTGALAAFGRPLEIGYRHAIDEAQASVRLVLRDNASDPGLASAQARQLVVDRGAAALLGPATPQLSIPVSVVADQLEVPLVITLTPVRAWQGASDVGWTWAWDLFFDELQMTRTQFLASDLVPTNRRVALFTDLEEDGVTMGALWEENALDHGYEIVYRAEFPVGVQSFGTQVAEAAAADADIVIAQVTPPDGHALLAAITDGNYEPMLVFVEKAGNTGGWPRLTNGLADGTLAANWFAEGIGKFREEEFVEQYRDRFGGVDSDLGVVVWAYTAARLLLDAIARAGTTDATAVNTEIAATDAVYPAGHVRFDVGHASAEPAVMTQWQGSDQVLVMFGDGTPGPTSLRVPARPAVAA